MRRGLRILLTTAVVGMPAQVSAQATNQPSSGPASPDAPEVSPPELVEFVEAEYPPPAQASGIEGVVELGITVGADGRVTDCQVLVAAGHGFDDRAVAAAKQFVFQPAMIDGEPTSARIRYRYVFELRDANPPPEQGPPDTPASTGQLVGQIWDATDDKPVAGAEVIVTQQGGDQSQRVVTGEDGGFALEQMDDGRYSVRIFADDYEVLELTEVVAAGEVTEVKYRIRPEEDPEEFGAVAVVDAPPREAVRRTITREELTRVPGTRGDALRTVELLPGVGRPPFGVGQLIVRGAAPQDSQVFLDGTPVPLLYHFGGLTSFYNSRLLDRIDFYPGNFSARFGRKTGGVLDVASRAPSSAEVRGVADVNVIDASLLVEAPIDDRLSVSVAGRRSYIDIFFDNIVPEDAFDVVAAPVYYDYQASAAWRVSDRDRLRFNVYGSSDEFRLVFSDPADSDPAIRENFELETQFHKFFVQWSRRLSSTVDQDVQIAAGPTLLEFVLGDDLRFDATFWSIDVRSEWRARLSPRVRLIAGLDVAMAPFRLDYRGPPPQQQEGNPNDQNPIAVQDVVNVEVDGFAFRPAPYAEVDLRPAQALRLVLGLRLDWYQEIGRWSFDPRGVAIWSLDEDQRIKLGVGMFSQPPEFQESSEDLGNENLRPIRSVHTGIGYERDVARGITVGAEGFYKYLSNRVVGTEGGLGSRFTNDGVGQIYGLELSGRVQPDGRRWFGFLSYTLSRSERRDGPDEPWRLFDFDQTHIFSIAGVYRLGNGWEAGATFRLVTGNPDTPITGSQYDANEDLWTPVFGRVNSVRSATFNRLDVRVEKLWTFDQWKLAAYLDVQNVYNATNAEGTIYNYDFTESDELPGLPIIPSLGVRGEL